MRILQEVTNYYDPKNLIEFLANFYIAEFLPDERKKRNINEFTYDRCFEMIHTYGIREILLYEKRIPMVHEFSYLISEYVAYFIGHKSYDLYDNVEALLKYDSFYNLLRATPFVMKTKSFGSEIAEKILEEVDEDTLQYWQDRYGVDEQDIDDFVNKTKNAEIMKKLLFLNPLTSEGAIEIYKHKHYFNDIPVEDFFYFINDNPRWFGVSPAKQLLINNCIYFMHHLNFTIAIDKIVDAEHQNGLLLIDMQDIFFSETIKNKELINFLNMKSNTNSIKELIPFASDSFQKMVSI